MESLTVPVLNCTATPNPWSTLMLKDTESIPRDCVWVVRAPQ